MELDAARPDAARLDIVVSGLASDAHTWNLVYLQLVLEEMGHRVTNLGACVPDGLLTSRCGQAAPDLVVLSSVNGHGFQDARRVIGPLRARLACTPVVVGGKLGVDGTGGHAEALLAAGFDAVFENADAIAAFRGYVERLAAGVRS
ncbi:methylaspartate mutase sigma subunit [Lentzea albidocapillata subsp. violacea]|uniref:Methylaspartate mutase sigma subunit n=1 Tax=Lentzea albidocapillata subsp. violacea TaxID=128104 RepID=A0A1G8SEL6_9PSEU|nr:cobalamin B12-binding domain-containing protein [Lentzea albidocapillata]SDJ27676.1 methylaspartate mutase sigma subunit [Lentzea albidocapillata subsp. violacea]